MYRADETRRERTTGAGRKAPRPTRCEWMDESSRRGRRPRRRFSRGLYKYVDIERALPVNFFQFFSIFHKFDVQAGPAKAPEDGRPSPRDRRPDELRGDADRHGDLGSATLLKPIGFEDLTPGLGQSGHYLCDRSIDERASCSRSSRPRDSPRDRKVSRPIPASAVRAGGGGGQIISRRRGARDCADPRVERPSSGIELQFGQPADQNRPDFLDEIVAIALSEIAGAWLLTG